MATYPKFLDRDETIQFRHAIEIWAARMNIRRNAVFTISPEYGRKGTWVKDRYYGRVLPKKEDIFWAEKFASTRTMQEFNLSLADLPRYTEAVRKMCYSCAAKDMLDQTATCWDGECPLRPVSPLPLRAYKKGVETKSIE